MEKYAIVTAILIALSFVYLKVADHFNIIDKPNNRSSHTEPTIRGGGVLFLFALWVYFFMSDFSYPFVVLGVSLIAFVSFVDDIKTLSSKIRLPFQFLAILLVMQEIDLFVLPWWMIGFVTIIGVGFMNYYNFMDGINGITGLYSLVVCSGLYIVNQEKQLVDQDLLRYIMISIVVFGFYNFRKKARCFAGDIGSISIAVLLFFIGGSLMYQLQAPVLILLVTVYSVDAILTIAYRKYVGEQIMEPHRHHIYQKLVDIKKLPHLFVAILYFLLQLLINVVVIYTFKKSMQVQLITVFCVILVCVLVYISAFKYLKSKNISEA